MAINRKNYQVELAARKSKSLHLHLQTSLLQLRGKQPQVPRPQSRAGYILTLRILAGLAVLTGIYFVFF